MNRGRGCAAKADIESAFWIVVEPLAQLDVQPREPDRPSSLEVRLCGLLEGGSADRSPPSAVTDGSTPIADLGAALRGLQAINQWLGNISEDNPGSSADPEMLTTVLTGLGHLDAAATAARARVIVAADLAGAADGDGAMSDRAWVVEKLRLTGASAAREVTFAHRLVGLPDTLAALESGRISREHATSVAVAVARQRDDQDHAETARRAQAELERAERARQAAAAAAAARSEAERRRTEQEAAERESRIHAQELADTKRRAAEAAAREEARRKELLDLALRGQSPDKLKQRARDQRADDADSMARAERAQFSRRSEKHWKDEDTGMGHVHAILPGEDYERYLSAFDACQTFDHHLTPLAERRTTEQRQADAFVDLIGAALAAGDMSTTQGVKPHLTLTGTIDAMTAQTDESATAQYGTRLSAEALRRIGCDAGLTRAILNATGQVLDVGRETRSWTVAQYRAAAITFGGCAFPVANGEACARPIGWTDLHHVRFWRNGGRTDQDNGVPLCRRHHRQVHRDDHNFLYDHRTITVRLERTDRDGRTSSRSVGFAVTARKPSGEPPGDPPDRLPL